MFNYVRRARAIAATVRRLEGEVTQLQQALKDTEQRCQLALERARLENLAVSKRMEAESEKVGKAVAAMFEQIRLAKAESLRSLDLGPQTRSGAS